MTLTFKHHSWYNPNPLTLKAQIADGLVTAAAGFVAAAFTKSEMVAVFAMSIAGAGIGGVLATMLSHIFTGPGLENMRHLTRWMVNFLFGLATGFFGAWELQERWMTRYPVEFCACLAAFVGGVIGVSLICIIAPRFFAWARDNDKFPFTRKQQHTEKEAP